MNDKIEFAMKELDHAKQDATIVGRNNGTQTQIITILINGIDAAMITLKSALAKK